MNSRPSDDPNGAAEGEGSPSPAAETSGDAQSEALQQELAEIRDLARSLMAAVHEVRAQNARSEMVRSAIQEVRADVRAASQAMLLAQPAAAPYQGTPVERQGKCPPCDCVDSGCCCFDIMVSQVRAAKPQIEPADAGEVGPLINALEVQMYFTVDGTGYLWPGLATTMDLRADGLPGGPGPWVVIERAVKRVCLPKGTSVTKQLRVEVREHDEGVERPIGMKDELGEALGSITLDCCMDRVFPAMPIDVPLVHGGEGRGMVQVAFYAQRVCC